MSNGYSGKNKTHTLKMRKTGSKLHLWWTCWCWVVFPAPEIATSLRPAFLESKLAEAWDLGFWSPNVFFQCCPCTSSKNSNQWVCPQIISWIVPKSYLKHWSTPLYSCLGLVSCPKTGLKTMESLKTRPEVWSCSSNAFKKLPHQKIQICGSSLGGETLSFSQTWWSLKPLFFLAKKKMTWDWFLARTR